MPLWLRSTLKKCLKDWRGEGRGIHFSRSQHLQLHWTHMFVVSDTDCYMNNIHNSTLWMSIKINTSDYTLMVPMAIHEIASVAAVLGVAFMPFNAQGTF